MVYRYLGTFYLRSFPVTHKEGTSHFHTRAEPGYNHHAQANRTIKNAVGLARGKSHRAKRKEVHITALLEPSKLAHPSRARDTPQYSAKHGAHVDLRRGEVHERAY